MVKDFNLSELTTSSAIVFLMEGKNECSERSSVVYLDFIHLKLSWSTEPRCFLHNWVSPISPCTSIPAPSAFVVLVQAHTCKMILYTSPFLQMTLFETCIMSSCVKPIIRSEKNPVVLLHCFDSSCLEWSYAFPLLEEAGLETWAVDVLGWGFSDLDSLPPCNVETKRSHLYQFWKTYIKRPMVLVGPSLGAAVALDFAVNHPEAVEKLVLINACVYSKCTGHPTKLPNVVAYAGVSLLKSIPLRLIANKLTFNELSLSRNLEWTNVGRLHCLLPWWEDTTVNFMNSGGYNVISQIKQVKHIALIIAGEDDKIIPYKDAVRLHCELPNAIMRIIADSGHLPHVDSPASVSKLITDFVLHDSC